MKDVLFVILDQYADWEAAPLASAINDENGLRVRTVSLSREPVRSIGGFTCLPDLSVSEAMDSDYVALILVGSDSWRTPEARHVGPLVAQALGRGTLVGGICDGSVFLGAMGALNEVAHTSNELADLQDFAGAAYSNASGYRREQAVRDGNVVTANGTAAYEFAREVMLALDAAGQNEIEGWYRFHKLGFYQADEQADAQ